MATKLQLITAMYEYHINRVTGSSAGWRQFLRSASRNYKLAFEEQILVHAQRPDATAVLELEKWNRQFGRWVNRRATGIAVIDRNVPGKRQLKYYFDISDTHAGSRPRPVPIWTMKQSYAPEVIETLEAAFGELAEKETLALAILSAVRNAVDDNITDYLHQLTDCLADSSLYGLDDEEIAVITRNLLCNSISYMLLDRCGIDAELFIADECFRDLHLFDTPDTVTVLGTATGDIAETGLREIASTVINLMRQEQDRNRTFDTLAAPSYTEHENPTERGFEHGTDIQRRERVSDSRPDPARRTRSNAWQIRPYAPQVSEESPQGDILPSADERRIESASIGDRAVSHEPDGDVGIADGDGAGRDGSIESVRPNEVGRDDEQYPALSGGNDTGGVDLRLETLPSPEEQLERIAEAEGLAEGRRPAVPSAFSMPIPQEVVDEELCGSGNSIHDRRFRIYHHFMQTSAEDENAQFLKNDFGISGGRSSINNEYYINSDGKGLAFIKGNLMTPEMKFTFSWKNAAKRIRELIAADRYLSASDKNILYPQYLDYLEERRIRRQKDDFIDEAAKLPPSEKRDTLSLRLADFTGGLERYEKEYLGKHGLSDIADATNTAQIDALLKDPRRVEQLRTAMKAIGGATTGVFCRNNAYRFGEELKGLYPRRLVYHLGDTVYIGSQQYEVMSFNDTTVQLFDTEFPLFHKEMPRDEFDRKAAENAANDHLMVTAEPAPEQTASPEPVTPTADNTPRTFYKTVLPDLVRKIQSDSGVSVFLRDMDTEAYEAEIEIGNWLDHAAASEDFPGLREALKLPDFRKWLREDILERTYQDVTDGRDMIERHEYDGDAPDWAKSVLLVPSEPETYTPKRGDRYEIQGRFFVVDSVDTDYESVSLRDVTFENNTGFPIFRSESLEFIRMYDPIQPEPQPVQPEPAPETLTPSWEKPKPRSRTQTFDAFPGIPMSERSNFTITDDNLGAGGAKTKYRYNVEAIRTLQRIEAEHRLATPDEQEILSRYVGWGGLADAFDKDKSAWTNEYVELQSLLTPEEYKSARASTVNAHYTSPTVIKAIYKAVENMGQRDAAPNVAHGVGRGWNILEPSCGIGNFFGLVPESMSDSKLFGVELDSLTGRIAQQLYQKNSIAIQGYENTNLPDSFFDLAIGNVPFGDYGVIDKRYEKHKFSIHDYFFAKTLDKVRPGGVMAFVTSKWMIDAKNPAVRKYIAQRADLVGAIRLPSNAFLKNAGTEVTTDIIFLQKRDRIIDMEPEWVHLGETENGIPVNSYFAEHPDMILGTMSNESGVRMYGDMSSSSCVPFPDADLSELLADAITNIHAEIPEYERGEDEPEEDNSIPADPNVRNFSYTLVNGRIYYRQDSRMMPVELPVTTGNRVKAMIALRECVRDLIMYQTDGYPDSDIQAEQVKLNRLYDDFVRKYGLINSRGNSIAFSQDSAYPLLCSLEVIDENGELERKADMFHKRTIKPHEPVTHVDTAVEALAVSMSEKARVDLPYMSQLTDMSEEAIAKELEGVIFLNPMHGYGGNNQEKYLTADEYLSGNVREKLDWAKRSAELYPEDYAVNVRALEAAQPQDLTAAEISVRLGATWLPEDVIERFMYELLGTQWRGRDKIKVHYSRHTGEWNVTEKSADRSNIHTFNTYGTQRINAYKIIEESLNLRDVRVFDKVYENGEEKRVLNKRETAIAQAKQELIRSKFEEWIWKDPTRRERLCRMYNDKFNCIRPREYDGSHIKFVGMNPEITLRKHQIDAIAHILYGGNTLLAHEVGAGKTFEMVAAAMESKRLGLCNKSLIVVPNHITEQWAAEFLQLYPSADILVATKKDFETKNRKKFCARIATGDYDAVIIGHSQFEKIPMSAERQQAMLARQIDELVDGIDEVKRNKGERFTIKQMEKAKKNLEVKLSKLNDQSRKDDVVTFEELGVDRLFIDESHYFKNLYLITKMRNVAGIAQTEAQKSSDLFMKTQYLDELTGGRGTVFATGTPISNSMVELYTIQRYLQYNLLVQSDLQHFDAWASTFGETVTAIELAPEGTGYRAKTRFAKFYNLPELMSMFRMTADIQTADMLNLPVPKANFHTKVITPTDWQKDMVAELADRAEQIRARKVNPSIDNMLKVTNDGRKLALDQRLANPLLPDDPEGKASTCADDVFGIWEKTKESRSAQLIFCDLSTPKKEADTADNDGAPAFCNVYDDIRKKLITKGIPAEEIAFIHDADTETKKKELFAKVRKGHVRILMGSTQKMGSGTNVQDKLIALFDLDCPWRPSDLAQRLGRIVRQGNQNPEVEVFRYVTEGTFDSYLYQLVENKQKFISQIMTSKTPVRSAEDIDETALSYAEIKALATGNPLIIEKCQLEMDVGRLKILHASHLSQRYALEDKILKEYPQEIKRQTERIAGYKVDRITVSKYPADAEHFPPMKIGGILYAEKKEAGTALIEACRAMTSPDPVTLGEYRGFGMVLSYDSYAKEYRVTLQGTLTHTVKLGTDIFGNITRLDNALEGFTDRLKDCESQLVSIQTQLEAAKSEVDRPFPQEQEYTEKSARLKELNILLNMDEKDEVLFDDAPDEGDIEPPPRDTGRER